LLADSRTKHIHTLAEAYGATVIYIQIIVQKNYWIDGLLDASESISPETGKNCILLT
jgi:fructose-bisphosphate aldolase class II